VRNRHWLFFSSLVLSALFVPASTVIERQATSTDSRSAGLANIVNEYWQHKLAHDFYQRFRSGASIDKLPEISEEHEKIEAAFAANIVDELQNIKLADLGHEDLLTLKVLRWQASMETGFAKGYWFDAQLTAHSSVLAFVQGVLQGPPMGSLSDLEHYLALLEQYPALIAGTHKMLKAQAEHGIVLPQEGIPAAKAFLTSLVQEPDKSPFFVDKKSLASIDPALASSFQEKVRQIIQARINPELQSLIAYVTGPYAAKAPDGPGLWRYPGGQDYYRFLVRLYTTLDISPEALHQRGLEKVVQLEAEMAALRGKMGFKGSREEFHQFLLHDPQFVAKTPEEVRERLLSYVHRIEPRLPSYFLHVPAAPYDVRRLNPALEGALTFGHYAEPSPGRSTGIYCFNGSQLSERTMVKAGPLILHELVPGHHFQINLTAENRRLPEFRRVIFVPAYSEGWGDYSSRLGAEMGAYTNDYDRYALLAQEMHQSVRQVVDTGLHAKRWGREQALAFMREHELESETQIQSEYVRYSIGTPGQALVYSIGSSEMLKLRAKAEKTLGKRFSVRDFHQCILGNGPMPLEVLSWHVDWCIAQRQEN
jgi:uncharacterized protein (DUF885 family)